MFFDKFPVLGAGIVWIYVRVKKRMGEGRGNLDEFVIKEPRVCVCVCVCVCEGT